MRGPRLPRLQSWVSRATSDLVGRAALPLHRQGGRRPGHDSYNAYNEALALKGYRIKLVSASGKYVIMGSRTIRNRAQIVLANKLQGVDLTAKYYPLRLVGPYIGSSKYLGRISKIVLLPR